MAKEKRDEVVIVEKSEPKMVRAFSQRQGDIGLIDGRVLKFGEVILVTEDVANWLTKSFAGFIKIID